MNRILYKHLYWPESQQWIGKSGCIPGPDMDVFVSIDKFLASRSTTKNHLDDEIISYIGPIAKHYKTAQFDKDLYKNRAVTLLKRIYETD